VLALAGMLAVSLWAAPARQAAPPAIGEPVTVTLAGRVTIADKGTYQEHAFVVPPGVTRLDVEFSYENQGAGTELEIGVFDTQRFRGTSRFSKQRFHIGEFEASPSYVPGPIAPGTWRLSLGIPSIGSAQTTAWRAVVRMSMLPSPREGLAALPLRDDAGWYAGDLHAHTLHSDGYGCEDAPGRRRGCQPWEVVEAARSRRLDFLAIADHNTTSHHADLAGLQESLTSLLLLRGQELTTFHGHANVYGTSRPIDFRLGFHGRTMADVMDDVAAAGALLSINHPGRETGDRCTGCGWDAPQTPWDRIEAMEVVNGRVVEGPTAGLFVWYARLNDGHRITGIGGGDEHGARAANIGTPTTVIRARELSEDALLEGIRTGQVYVRTRGPEGPVLELTATAGDRQVATGEIVAASIASPLALSIRTEGAAGQRLQIVRHGTVAATLDVASDRATLSHAMTLSSGQWVHVRLRDAQGITAFSNPIYVK